jgi:methionyl-tRNA formyltransferase
MRLVFCGTPDFAVPALKHLLALPEFEVAAAISQPDRPRGRGHQISASPVKQTALAAGIPVHQPPSICSDDSFEFLVRLAPDAVVIIAYGQIIPQRLLAIAKYGWINLHASMLPKYRGAAPIHWAIVNGETTTGLTTMRIDAGLDTGGILLQQQITIGRSETAPELAVRMAEAGEPLMVETLRGLRAGTLAPRPQNHSAATYAPLLKKADGRIDWTRTADQIFNRMRGFAPWPGAYALFHGRLCRVWGEPLHETTSSPPGRILRSGSMLRVACGGGTLLRLDGVKLPGGQRISAEEFAHGIRMGAEDSFET